MANDYMLTTIDNPYDPFNQFALWMLFDIEKGYFTCEYLGRVVKLFDGMTEKEMNDEIDRAIDEIIFNNPAGIYKKVTENAITQ